jgi:hypothetical protein
MFCILLLENAKIVAASQYSSIDEKIDSKNSSSIKVRISPSPPIYQHRVEPQSHFDLYCLIQQQFLDYSADSTYHL